MGRGRKSAIDRLAEEILKQAELRDKLVPGSGDYTAADKTLALLKYQNIAEREALESEAARREAESVSELYKDIQQAVAAAARARGLDYVVRVAPGPKPTSNAGQLSAELNRAVIYADPKFDLTEDVVRDLNRRYTTPTAGTSR